MKSPILAALVAAQLSLTCAFGQGRPNPADLATTPAPAAQQAPTATTGSTGGCAARPVTPVATDNGELARARAERDAAVVKADALRRQHAAASHTAVANRQRQAARAAELRRLTVAECRSYTDRSVQAALTGVKDAVATAQRAEAETKVLAGAIAQTDANVKALTEKVTAIDTRLSTVESAQRATDMKVSKLEGIEEERGKRLSFLETLVLGLWPGSAPADATPAPVTDPTPTPAPTDPTTNPTLDPAAGITPAPAPTPSAAVPPATTPTPTAPEATTPMATPATEAPKAATTPSPVKKPTRPINTNLLVLIGIALVTLFFALGAPTGRFRIIVILVGALVALAWCYLSGMM